MAQRHTRPELQLRKALHREGFRYRLHDRRLPGTPDIVFPKFRTAIFVNGCFWHGHECRAGRPPTSRTEYWLPKIEGNRARDARKRADLAAMGWRVVTIWECELRDIGKAVDKVRSALGEREASVVERSTPLDDNHDTSAADIAMHGPEILARTLSVPGVRISDGTMWQYHGRSDRHSKVACWGIVFDLLRTCPLLRQHVANGKVCFGINHEMHDFQQKRKKNLDLVLCTPSSVLARHPETLVSKIDDYGIILNADERRELEAIPVLRRASVGSVLVALEAKACMTAHQKALPRLYDELNSSHLTVHGATDEAIAAAFVMINAADTFSSPTNGGRLNKHGQPRATEIVVAKVGELPRRSVVGRAGFDAIAIVVAECRNDGSVVRLVRDDRAPPVGDAFSYESMIRRVAQLYATRFTLI